MQRNRKTMISRGVAFEISDQGQFINLHYPDGMSGREALTYIPTEQELSAFLGYGVICIDEHARFSEYARISKRNDTATQL